VLVSPRAAVVGKLIFSAIITPRVLF
jgi:hypothetical protein